MFRRDWLKQSGFFSAACALPMLSQAQTNPSYQEGQDYIALDKRVNTDAAGGRIEVIDFFWYNCPHCNAFQPKMEQWMSKLPASITVRRVPVAFRDEFEPQQRLFYTLEALNKLSSLHKKVFYTIHVDKKALATPAAIRDWVVAQGVDKGQFDSVFNSFAIQTKIRRATQLQNDYKVGGVPALGIAGRFYTDGSLAQSMDRALRVTDWLISEVRKGR